MPEAEPSMENGLQIWTPEVSFAAQHNIDVYNELLKDLAIIDVRFNPGEETPRIFCIADQMAYQVVGDEEVNLYKQDIVKKKDYLSALSLHTPLEPSAETLDEEARARALHLGLGKACLMLIADTDDALSMIGGVHDLVRIFDAIKAPIHNFENLMYVTPRSKSSLLTTLARRLPDNVAVKQTDATKIVQSLNRGLRTPANTREDWYTHSGNNLLKRLLQSQDVEPDNEPLFGTLARERVTKAAPRLMPSYKDAEIKMYNGTKSPKSSVFIKRVMGPDGRHFNAKLNELHEKYCEFGVGWDIKESERKDLKRNVVYGVAGYLEFNSERSRLAADVFRYLTADLRSVDARKIISVGCVLVGKWNAQQVDEDERIDYPTLGSEGYVQAFDAIRHIATRQAGRPESPQHQKYAELVRTYIEASKDKLG